MGWGFWSSSPAEGQSSKVSADEPTRASPSRTPTTAPAFPAETAPAVPPPSLSRDETADQELHEFLAQVSAEINPSSTSTVSTTLSSDNRDDASFSAKSTATSNSLYPSTMSCTAAFDSAFYCQSMGGQFVNVYRYGGIKDCSEHWSAFWFCMRHRGYPEDEKATMIQDFYREKAAKYKLGPSSEDIWKARDEPVVGAFARDPDEYERKLKEMEARRAASGS